jgi:predicted metal-dependent hydrolase
VTSSAAAAFMRSVRYGDADIAFEYVRVDRATLEIAVLPDGAVVVKVPQDVREDDVFERVARRARWILRQQRYFAQFQPRTPPRRYVGGETHRYLGRQCRLAVEQGDTDCVRLVAGWIRVTVAGVSSPACVQRLLDRWYQEKARHWLPERVSECWQRFPSAGLEPPTLRLRRMQTHWGSMSAAGTLSLHPDLIRAPCECIDYVIIHELCHLVYANHGAEFHRLLEHVLPDWQRRKHRLEVTMA